MRLKKYMINESLFKIDQRDIKMIYRPLQKYVKNIQLHVKNRNAEGLINTLKLIRKRGKYAKAGPIELWALTGINSAKLKSMDARQAHKVNPINIFIGFPTEEPFYSPNFNVIVIGPPLANLDPLTGSGMMAAIDDEGLYDFFEHFSSEQMVKNLIRHELTHWLDDSLHNFHLRRKSEKGQITGRSEDVVDYYELQAIIHQVDQLRADLGEKYFDLTWQQFLTKCLISKKILSI